MQMSSATSARLREDRGDLLPDLPNFLNAMLRPKAGELGPLKLGDRLALGERFRHRLAVHLGQLRLVIEAFPDATDRRPCRAR